VLGVERRQTLYNILYDDVMCLSEVDSGEFRSPDLDLDEFHHKATRTLFIGNLDKAVTKDVLRNTFNKFGPIVVSIALFTTGPLLLLGDLQIK